MGGLYEYVKMAVQNIRANKGRSFLTMLGIIIGIASVIAIVSIGEGTKNQMNSEIDGIGSGLIAIDVSSEAMTEDEWITPEDVQENDVIAFYGATDGSSIITHRVVTNSTVMGEFITKGDANEEKDMNPIPYSHFIGKVVLTVPKVGGIAQTFTSTTGKIAAACMIALAVVLHIIAAVVGTRGEQ